MVPEEVTAWLDLLDGTTGEAASDGSALLDVLLDLHIVSWTVGDEYTTENTAPVDLVQISAQTDNEFAHQSKLIKGKLGGASIARFSGFLKRSWRMNDWTWGRCDAATMLTRIVVSPARLRRYAKESCASVPDDLRPAKVVDRLLCASYGVQEEDLADWRREKPWADDLYGPAVADVSRALADAAPYDVKKLTALLSYARHAEIALEELPLIAGAIVADRLEGANPRSRGELFLIQSKALLARIEQENSKPPAEFDAEERLRLGLGALTAFDVAGIGREPLDQERSSDQMIRTAVTAAGVAATVVDSPSAGLGRVNPVTRVVRGAMMLPYWATLGLTSGTRIARFLALLAVAVGGVLLALSLLGILQAPLAGPAAMVGGGTLVFAFAYAAMRTGSLLHGLVMLSAGVPLAAVGLTRAFEKAPDGQAPSGSDLLGIGTVGAVVVLVMGLLVLGSLPTPVRSPWQAGRGLRTAVSTSTGEWVTRFRKLWSLRSPTEVGHRWIPRLGRNLVMAAVLVGLGLLCWRGGQWLAGDPTWHGATRILAWVVACSAALGALFALVSGALLGSWQWVPGDDETEPPGRVGAFLRRLWNGVLGTWHAQASSDAGRWVGAPVSLPAGVTVGWSWVYGVLYVAAALGVVRWGGSDRYVWATAALLGATVLFLLVPVFIPLRARRRVSRNLLQQAAAGLFRPPKLDHLGDAVESEPGPEMSAWLAAHGMAFRYLTSPSGEGGKLVLRASGTTLALKVRAAVDRWQADRLQP